MKKILSVAVTGIMITVLGCTSSKEEKVLIGAFVRDANTMDYFNDAKVEIMNLDSVVLSDPIVREVVRDSQDYRYVWSVPRQDKYIIRASKKGYSTEYMNVSLKKDEEQKLADEILMKPTIVENN